MRFAKTALLGAATLAGVLVLPLTGQAQPAFSAQQRQAIEQIVKEQQKTAQATALTQEREKLLNSPRNNVVGNPSGDVTLVEFFDYNCGYCKRALGDLQTLMKADPKLRVVLNGIHQHRE